MVGASSTSDVFQTQARLDEARVRVTKMRRDLRDAESTYEMILGSAPGELVDPQFSPKARQVSLEETLKLAINNMPKTKMDDAGKRILQAEVRRSWNAYEASMAGMDQSARAIKFGTLTRDAYRQQFEIAQRTLLDLLGAQRELFLSRIQHVSISFDKRLAEYRILAVSGTLLQTLGISPPK
jgi:outer membrane protein TolC